VDWMDVDAMDWMTVDVDAVEWMDADWMNVDVDIEAVDWVAVEAARYSLDGLLHRVLSL